MTTLKITRLLGMVFLSGMIVLAEAHHSVDDCKHLGYSSANLLCSTCEKLNKFDLNDLYDNCRECCVKDDVTEARYPKAVLEVCTCKFPAYPQIEAFIKNEKKNKKYTNLQIKYVRGLDPIMRLYDADNKLQDQLDITKWNTDSVDEFLHTHLVMD
ncbi:selenoprotein F [Venturia canescens]|uniref:selenoprotein F n=1 Tax=Venturia canescens TaxID=32260 RepID=UPI001C9C4C79|nr:selenoprotein F [Venturia canescens]